MKKLNLQAPKTMQDVLNISHAFATMDPDGNGKPDTIGLSLQKRNTGQRFRTDRLL
ncbi:hypothetical protein [Cohnella rhizosphaerae]|uniref:Uncharacterized protein n=1 Tax=Cohnella rhizosphaerae TaxID=1457232 RepID=A0A9X4KQC5_9BACL|nr:hypothetical protein [Cohnella rhizosphaerae]MDG0808862.1 hypothetical protein [Cohnella rhizosphaerae]